MLTVTGLALLPALDRQPVEDLIVRSYGPAKDTEILVHVEVESTTGMLRLTIKASHLEDSKVFTAPTVTELENQLVKASTLAEEAMNGMKQTAAWHTIGIIAGSGDKLRKIIGTGGLVTWRGHPLVLTAEHVIEDTRQEDLSFLLRPTGTSTFLDLETLRSLTAVEGANASRDRKLPIRRICVDKRRDLAAIVLDDEVGALGAPVRHFQLASGGRSPALGTTILFKGIPHSISRVTVNNEWVRFPITALCHIVAPPANRPLQDFDPAVRFLVHCALKDEFPDVEPHGVSGSAAWHRLANTPLVWHSNLELAGVITDWYATPQLLSIVRREEVEAFLDEQLPTERT